VNEENILETGTSTHDAAIHVAHLGCDSLDEFEEATSGWDFDWRQLDRGPLNASVLQVATQSVLASRFSLSRKFHQRGASPQGMQTFGIVSEHSSPVEWRGVEGTTNQIQIFPRADEYECVSHAEFRADGVSIAEDRIRLIAEILGLPDPLERFPAGPCFVESNPHRMEILRGNVARLHEAAATHADSVLSETACSELEFDVQSALVSALATSLETESRQPYPTLRSRALRLALDYIEEHADDAPTVMEICRAAGASYRTLNYAFLDRFGVTPKRYLQAVRLNGVRKILRTIRPHGTIIDIANHWGFWHMGQFAADYRRQFGELPSQTARRTTR